jgi:hypothetical protein
MTLNLDAPTLANDSLLDQWIRDNFVARKAYFETCPMGQAVDNRYRVNGVQKLRVCDSTVMNKPSQGISTYASAAMGDICGRMVLEDAGYITPSSKKSVHHPLPPKKRRGTPKTPPRTTTTTQKRMDDTELWALYVRALQDIETMFPGRRGVKMQKAIKMTDEYIRLRNIYVTVN